MTFFEIFSQIYKLSNISKLPQVIRIFKFSKKSCEFSSLEQRKKGGISLIIFENINLHKTCPRKGRANNMKYFALNAKQQAPFRALDCAAQRVGPPSWSHAPLFPSLFTLENLFNIPPSPYTSFSARSQPSW